MGTINKTSVDKAQARERDWFLWDESLPGFGLKVTPAGGKSYVFQYRCAAPGKSAKTAPRRYTIGKHGAVTAEQARKRARELAALVTQGIDPRQQEIEEAAERERALAAEAERERIERDLEFGRIADLWLDEYENEPKPDGGFRSKASISQARLVVDQHLRPALEGKPMPDITRDELEPILSAIPAAKRAMRRTVYVYASILWNWAVRRRYAPDNPFVTMEKPPAARARDHVLDDAELHAVWKAADTLKGPFASFIRLLILTGQRRSEVAGLRWEELDRASATWTIPAHRAKNGKAHVVPLADPVLAEIDALATAERKRLKSRKDTWPAVGPVLTTNHETSISGISKAKAALDAALEKAEGQPLRPWRLHDLRRTLATGLQRLKVRFEVTEAILNHVSGSKGGVAGVYQKFDWQDEKRAALAAWAEFVLALGTTPDSNVVSIAGRRA